MVNRVTLVAEEGDVIKTTDFTRFVFVGSDSGVGEDFDEVEKSGGCAHAGVVRC